MFESQYPHHRLLTHLTLVFVIASLAGCKTTADFRLPDNRFLTPESRGETWQGRFSPLGYGSKTNVILAQDDAPENAPGTVLVDNSTLRKDDGFYLHADLALVPRVDFFSINGGNGLKVQVLGAPEASAHSGNLSVAVAAGYDAGTIRNFQRKEDFVYHDTSSRVRYEVIDWMGLAGVRLTNDMLVYGNFAAARFRGTGRIRHEVRSMAGSVYSDYTVTSPERSGRQFAALCGIRATDSQGAYAAVEGGYVNTVIDGGASVARLALGTIAGMVW